MKIDADEKEPLESVERGEWKSAKGGKRERARYARYAKATLRKDRRLNIKASCSIAHDVEQCGRLQQLFTGVNVSAYTPIEPSPPRICR